MTEAVPVDRRWRRLLSGRAVVLGLLGVAAVAGMVGSSGSARALAVLALATAPALFAVPPAGRTLLGLLLVAAAVAVAAGTQRDAATWTSAGALVVAGALVAWRGRSWPALPGRYERGGTPPPPTVTASDPRDLWKALDRGEDPTGGDLPR